MRVQIISIPTEVFSHYFPLLPISISNSVYYHQNAHVMQLLSNSDIMDLHYSAANRKH